MFASLVFVLTVLPLTFATVGAETFARSPYDQEAYYCILPPYPQNGRYTVSNYPYATPGERYSSVKLDISCDTGYLNNTIKSIFCVNGEWSESMPTCVWDLMACGLKTQDGQLEGASSNHQELPWHAVIYFKNTQIINQIYSGSLLTATKIISTASFFHTNDGPLPASDFVVAGNKMYSKYNDTRDSNCQYSDVTDIKVPSNFRRKDHSIYYYDYNIAILIVKTPFHSHMYLRPACLDFDYNLDTTQIIKKSSGKAIQWSLTGDSDESKVLTVVDVPYFKYEDCKNMIANEHQQYLAKDQFCTRYNIVPVSDIKKIPMTLAFLESTTHQYYLRGIVSSYITSTDGKAWVVVYTSIAKHEDFIKQHL